MKREHVPAGAGRVDCRNGSPEGEMSGREGVNIEEVEGRVAARSSSFLCREQNERPMWRKVRPRGGISWEEGP